MSGELILHIIDQPLPYEERLAARSIAEIDLLVIHCTELPSMVEARQYGERLHYAESKTGCSGHYYIDRRGTVIRYVADQRVAHHAKAWNRRSIGVELVNLGRYPDWFRSDHQRPSEQYPEAQLEALLELASLLRERLPALQFVAGHEDLDRDWLVAEDDPSLFVRRKIDPGPLFPWPRVETEIGLERLPVEPDPPLPSAAPLS